MKRVFHVFVAFSLLISAARAGPEFRVVTGLLTLFDGGRKTPIRYNTQTDANFEEGGSVRVFSTVTPEGMAEVEVMARSKVDFYFLGADVSLAPSGTIRATVEDIKHPQIKLTWDGGSASAAKLLQTPEELLSYFIVSQPPVFSKSPIADDELSRIYPQAGQVSNPTRPGAIEEKDAVDVDFPFATPSPGKDSEEKARSSRSASPRPKPSPSPRSRSTPGPRESDKALLAQVAQSPGPSPTPKSAPSNVGQKPEELPKPTPSPSPDLMPDLPASGSDFPSAAPNTILGDETSTDLSSRLSAASTRGMSGNQAATRTPALDGAPILKSLLPGAAPASPPVGLVSRNPSAIKDIRDAEELAKMQQELLDGTGVQAPRPMPKMHAPIANQVPDFLPLTRPAGTGPNTQPRRRLPEQAANQSNDGPPRNVTIERPDIVLGGQREFTQVLRAWPADDDRGLGNEAVVQTPQGVVPDLVVLYRKPHPVPGPRFQATPFVISSTITGKGQR